MAEQQQLRFFYKGRMTKPKEYTYSEEGNAIRLNKDGGGGIRATVTLPTYRAPTETELLAQEATRRAAIGVAETKFDEARIHLLTLTANEDSLPNQLKQGMLAVALADQELQQVRYPLKYVNVYPSIPTNRLMFDSPRDERVLTDVRVFKSRPFSLQETYVRTSKISGASEEEVQGVPAEGGPPEEASGPVIVFSLPSEEDPYGFLSSWWPVYMTFKGTVYRNAYQAIQAEIAEYFGRQDLAVTIRDTEQPEDIELRVDMLPEATQDTWDAKMRELVLAVTREKFDAHPELAEKLVQTGDAVLGAVPPEDPSNTLLGIGMGTDHPSAKNPSKWTGQNVYGKALEEVREAIMTRRKGMVAQAPVLLEPPAPPPPVAPSPARLPRRLRNTAATAVQSIAEVAGQAQQGIVDTVSSIATAVTEALSPSSDTSPGTIVSSTSSGTTSGTSSGTANSSGTSSGTANSSGTNSSGTTTSSDTKRTVSISSNITRALDPLKNL